MNDYKDNLRNYKENLRKNIKALRKSRGLSQKEFAEKIGKTQGFISQVEKGISFVDAETLFDICQAFDVSPDFFSGNIRPDLPNTRILPEDFVLLEEQVLPIANLIKDNELMEAVKKLSSLPPDRKKNVIDTINLLSDRDL